MYTQKTQGFFCICYSVLLIKARSTVNIMQFPKDYGITTLGGKIKTTITTNPNEKKTQNMYNINILKTIRLYF